MSNSSYNPKELESRIDGHRLGNDWKSVCGLIERYARVFDVGAVSTAVDSDRSRSYYWTVMAEIMAYYYTDIETAGYCVVKASESDECSIEWRVLLAKILLERFGSIILPSKEPRRKESAHTEDAGSRSPNFNSPTRGISNIDTSVYTEAIESLKIQDRRSIQNSLADFSSEHHRAIMCALVSLSFSEIVQIFQEVLSEMKRLHLHPKHDRIKPQWVYIICKRALVPIRLMEAYNACLAGEISEYSLWLQLDAVSARAVIHELCSSRHQARSDMQQVVRLVKSSTTPLSRMPVSCRNVVIYTSCRLPLLELDLNMTSEALASFKLCIAGDSALAPHLSVPVQIALCIAAGELMLRIACVASTTEASEEKSQEEKDRTRDKAVRITSGPLSGVEESKLLLDTAHGHLLTAKRLMSAQTHGTINRDISNDSPNPGRIKLDQHISSMHWHIPSTKSDPHKLLDRISAGRLAVSLMGASMRIETPRGRVDSLELLEWGLACDTTPSLELLWNLGVAYVSSGLKIDEGLELMRQCIPLAASLSADEIEPDMPTPGHGSNTSTHRAGGVALIPMPRRVILLEWLGLSPQPSGDFPTLPAVVAAHVALKILGDPELAIACVHEGLQAMNPVGRCILRGMDTYTPPSTWSQRSSPSKPYVLSATPASPGSIRSIYPNDQSIVPFTTQNLAQIAADRSLKSNSKQPSSRGPRSIIPPSSGTFWCVLMIIRSYAMWARDSTLAQCIGAEKAADMRAKALKYCSFLSSDDFAAAHLCTNFSGHATTPDNLEPSAAQRNVLAIEHAVLLAEVGDISKAIELIKGHVEVGACTDLPQALHLLSVLLSCGTGDAQVISSAISVCSNALSAASRRVVESPQMLRTSDVTPNALSSLVCGAIYITSTVTPLDIANIQLTLARIKWSVGNKEQAVRLTDELVGHVVSSAAVDANRNSGSKNSANTPAAIDGPKSALGELQLKVALLTGASQLYRMVENFSRAQMCLEEAWRTLFSFHPQHMRHNTYVQSESRRMSDISTVLSRKYIEKLNLELDTGYGYHRSEEGAGPAFSEARWLGILRQIPTMHGWRLSEATGWGARLPTALEAEVLAECAELVFGENQVEAAVELLTLALSIHPVHARSMLCLAKIELNAFESQDVYDDTVQSENTVYSSNKNGEILQLPPGLHKANRLAQMAVDQKHLSPDAWHTLGRSFQNLNIVDKAADAFVTSLECQQYSPIRDFAEVLY